MHEHSIIFQAGDNAMLKLNVILKTSGLLQLIFFRSYNFITIPIRHRVHADVFRAFVHFVAV